MTEETPTHIYVGLRDAVIAEVGVPDFYAGKWLVAPYGKGNFLLEGCNTKAQAKECGRQYVKQVPGVKVVWL